VTGAGRGPGFVHSLPLASHPAVRHTSDSLMPVLGKLIVAAGVAASSCALGIAVSACSGHTSTPPTSSNASLTMVPTCEDAGLSIAFNPMYSAYIDDGMHTFQVPAVVYGSDGTATWYADSNFVGMQQDNERTNEVLLSMRQAGTTTITVQTSDGKCASAPLNISEAMESDWEIGNQRYNDGKSVHVSSGAGGGSPLESGQGGPACTNCHGETATNGPFTNVSHTPEQTGGFSDDDILNIVLNGTFPPNAFFDWTIVTYPAWQNFHRWADIMPDQQRGIIVYLRSLTPVVQRGSVNFGFFDTEAGAGVAVGDAASE
jgi:hypothetical protein